MLSVNEAGLPSVVMAGVTDRRTTWCKDIQAQ